MTLILPTLRTDRQKGFDNLIFSRFREESSRPEVKRVERILSLFVSANTSLQEWNKPITTRIRDEFVQEVQRRSDAQNAYRRTLDRLNAAVQRYEWRSEIVGDAGGIREELAWSDKVADGMPVWEHAVVRMILGLVNVPGEIDRFGHCVECRGWFYAATSHQRFCGDPCRRRHTASSTEFKQKRRLYMQQTYRPQQKQREMESRVLVRRVDPKLMKGK